MTMTQKFVFMCNGADAEPTMFPSGSKFERLEYREGYPDRNVAFQIPKYVLSVQHVPARALDLLELASYVFCADRHVSRGEKDAVVYTRWSRSITIVMAVRDWSFWSDSSIMETLSETLGFMSGHQFEFQFLPGHSTPPVSLLDSADLVTDAGEGSKVVLFSGGLDSLAGVVSLLETESNPLYLVSHRSQTGTFRTQTMLFKAFERDYPDSKLAHLPFACNLRGARAEEETQRTRFFLYSAVAYTASVAMRLNEFTVFENGITSLNLAKSQPLMNARNSRTTHPKTIAGMRRFFRLLGPETYEIHNPFEWKTKAEVIDCLVSLGRSDLISSSVSCSRTFDDGVKDQRTHCGRCSQCIDRRIGMYAAQAQDFDNESLYVRDLIHQDLGSGEAKTTLVDYIRQALSFTSQGIDAFFDSRLDALTDVIPFIDLDDDQSLERVYDLCIRHGKGVLTALKRIQMAHEDLSGPVATNSLLGVVSEREYLTEPIRRASTSLSQILKTAVPLSFQHERPKNEAVLQDAVNGFLLVVGLTLRPNIRIFVSRSQPRSPTNTLMEPTYVSKQSTSVRIHRLVK